MNIIFFFFTLFQNFMVPLDSSWWDLFKSAESPQFTINLPSLFGTYLWIFFIFTSVPILKKSCCRKNQIFSRNILPSGEHREWTPLGTVTSTTTVDGPRPPPLDPITTTTTPQPQPPQPLPPPQPWITSQPHPNDSIMVKKIQEFGYYSKWGVPIP